MSFKPGKVFEISPVGSGCWERQGTGVLGWELSYTILALVVLGVFGCRACPDRRRTSECSSPMAMSLRGC